MIPRTLQNKLFLTWFLIIFPTLAQASADPFATRVIEYTPAPGQRVRDPLFNDPARALGPPVGGGRAAADNSKLLTLGGFGGTIILGFDHPIWHNPHNPRGMDFIVFGNAFYAAFGANAQSRFAEPGVVEVSKDMNANGLADDPWYVIPGSHLAPGVQRTTVSYDTSTLNSNWIPLGRSGSWTVSGYLLSGVPFNARPPLLSTDPMIESIWGYADLSPIALLGDTDGDDTIDDTDIAPSAFYTRPDDPRAVGLSRGGCGGDAFSLAWAVDESTGAPANLDRIDFVRVTSAVNLVDALLGEVSTEISGVSDVPPHPTADWNLDTSVSVQDVFDFLSSWFAGVGEHGGADFDTSSSTTVQDIFAFLAAWFAA